MDPRLAFWTAAFVNMLLIVALAIRGVGHARRKQIESHLRCMLAASALVVGFVVAYVAKLAFLGREPLEVWGPRAVLTLRVHETCVLAMIVGGAIAGRYAWGMRAWARTRAERSPGSIVHPDAPRQVTWHRRGGWTAVMGAVLGAVTAAAVLYGMYARAGLV